MNLSYRIRGNMLNVAFKVGIAENPPFKVQAFDGTTSVSDKYDMVFDTPDDFGQIDMTGAINIAVGQVEVNRLRIYRYNPTGSDYTSLYATIDLEGTEIKDFSGEVAGGIYRINAFRVAI